MIYKPVYTYGTIFSLFLHIHCPQPAEVSVSGGPSRNGSPRHFIIFAAASVPVTIGRRGPAAHSRHPRCRLLMLLVAVASTARYGRTRPIPLPHGLLRRLAGAIIISLITY